VEAAFVRGALIGVPLSVTVWMMVAALVQLIVH